MVAGPENVVIAMYWQVAYYSFQRHSKLPREMCAVMI